MQKLWFLYVYVLLILCFVLLFHLQILQNLGKVDRTADEIFDEHVSNFNKQQGAATRLQKELNNYIRCIRGNNVYLNCQMINLCCFFVIGNHLKNYNPNWSLIFFVLQTAVDCKQWAIRS